MATPAKIVHDQLFAGASPPGNLTTSYLQLVLLLVNAVNPNTTSASPPQQVIDYLTSLAGQSFAVADVAKQLNTLRERYARANA
jgi:hypothetical protein